MFFYSIHHLFNTEGGFGVQRVHGRKMDMVEKLKNSDKKSRNRLVSGFFVGAPGQSKSEPEAEARRESALSISL